MNKHTMLTALRRACEQAGGQNAWARLHKVSGAHVSSVLTLRREPGAKILNALGLERIVVYRRVER